MISSLETRASIEMIHFFLSLPFLISFVLVVLVVLVGVKLALFSQTLDCFLSASCAERADPQAASGSYRKGHARNRLAEGFQSFYYRFPRDRFVSISEVRKFAKTLENFVPKARRTIRPNGLQFEPGRNQYGSCRRASAWFFDVKCLINCPIKLEWNTFL